jgi:tryptophanyl-tRNA synthetase
MSRKVMLSAMQPTNLLTLGNYLGALKNWVKLQKDYDCIFFAVDLHSLTVRQDPQELKEATLRAVATYIAGGIDPESATLFVQSQVSEHAELAWVLGCFAYMGELGRMTQFKDKSAKQGQNIPTGLFTYPVLMAADILLYKTNLVPVGEDQRQHLELTRDVAIRMNNLYGKDLFVVPEGYHPPVGARIMSLQDPTSSEIVASYTGKMYGHLKADTAELVAQAVAPIRAKTDELLADRSALEKILAQGAERARARAKPVLQEVYRRIGFLPRS